MTTVTLRRWGGAVAVSLPKKVLATLGLDAGSRVQVAVEDGSVVLSPARQRFTLEQLLMEQAELTLTADPDWLSDPARGREVL